MAHVLRLKLQALYFSRLLSSPAVASKLLDARRRTWRCYGESALLKESCNSTLNANDIDGDSKDTNNGGDSAKKGGVEDKVSTESNLDKLTSSIYEKFRAMVNKARVEKDNGFQGQVDPLLTKQSKKEDIWQPVVSSARTMALKNKAKEVASGKLDLSKTEAKEDQHDFCNLDLPEAGGESGVSREPNASNKGSLVMHAFGKSFKQKMSHSQFSHQQKLKDTKPFSFLKSLDKNITLGLESIDGNTTSTQTEISENKTVPLFTETDFSTEDGFSELKSGWDRALPPESYVSSELRSSLDRNHAINKDAMPDGVDSNMSKDEDNALPRAAQEGSILHVWNQSKTKDTTQGMSDFKAEGSGSAPPAQLHGKIPSYVSDATYEPSHNDNSIPRTVYMVCVQNLPASSNPAMIKASMAIYGEVLGVFKKNRNDKFHAYIQFKTELGMESAIAARKLQIGSKSFVIVRTDPVFSTVVRLSKVNLETTEKQLFSICGKYGSIYNIRKRSIGVYDVFYQVKELPNMTSILGSLNEVTLNRYPWIAVPAPTLHPSVQKEALKSPEGQAWHEQQVNQALNRIELGIEGVSILFEDLKELTALGKEFLKR